MNGKIIYLFLLLALLHSPRIVAQQAAGILDTINNQLSHQHVELGNTGIYLVPPTGYIPMSKGLRKDRYTLIISNVIRDPGVIASMPPLEQPMPQDPSMRIVLFKKVLINGLPGAYLHVKHGMSEAYSVLYGNAAFRVMITGACQSSDATEGARIVNSLSTVYYKP